jgi:hypothetical protein
MTEYKQQKITDFANKIFALEELKAESIRNRNIGKAVHYGIQLRDLYQELNRYIYCSDDRKYLESI